MGATRRRDRLVILIDGDVMAVVVVVVLDDVNDKTVENSNDFDYHNVDRAVVVVIGCCYDSTVVVAYERMNWNDC